MSEPNGQPQPYWAVIANESSGHISVESFDSRSDMVGRFRVLVHRGGYRVFVFQGRRLQISKPPHRFLLDGPDQIPLFEIKVIAEEDESGELDSRVEDGTDEVYRAILAGGSMRSTPPTSRRCP